MASSSTENFNQAYRNQNQATSLKEYYKLLLREEDEEAKKLKSIIEEGYSEIKSSEAESTGSGSVV